MPMGKIDRYTLGEPRNWLQDHVRPNDVAHTRLHEADGEARSDDVKQSQNVVRFKSIVGGKSRSATSREESFVRRRIETATPCDPNSTVKLYRRHAVCRCKRIRCRDRQQQSVLADRFANQPVHAIRWGMQQAEIDLAVAQRAQLLCRTQRLKLYFHTRKMPSEPAYGCRKYAGVHRGLDIADRDFPDFPAPQGPRPVLRACRMSQQRTRFVKEGFSRFGQEQALTGPLEELQSEAFLEGKDMTTQRRSRDVETQCCLRKVFAFGYGNKAIELSEI